MRLMVATHTTPTDGAASGERTPEVALIERARQGDERAIAALYRTHAAWLAALVYRLMGDAVELEDVLQETFVAAFRGLHGLQEAAAFGGWLTTIATRNVQRRLAARSRWRWWSRSIDAREQLRPQTTVSVVASDLEKVLVGLEPTYRIPWVLVRLEGHGMQEAADICGVSLATVKRRVAHGEDFLRRRLADG